LKHKKGEGEKRVQQEKFEEAESENNFTPLQAADRSRKKLSQ